MIENKNRTDMISISKYEEINLDDVLTEYLSMKGTWTEDFNGNRQEGNKTVSVKDQDLLNSALWLYGLKYNNTNKRNCAFIIEKQARRRCIIKNEVIVIPFDIWDKCNKMFNQKQ